MRTLTWILKNLHLLISLSIVIPTAFIYGFSPTTLLPRHLDIVVTTTDLSNFLRAVMFLYLGCAAVWMLGIVQLKHWKKATQLNVLFMLTLGLGRIVSIILDGFPSGGYVFGVIAEIVIGVYALYQLKIYNTTSIR